MSSQEIARSRIEKLKREFLRVRERDGTPTDYRKVVNAELRHMFRLMKRDDASLETMEIVMCAHVAFINTALFMIDAGVFVTESPREVVHLINAEWELGDAENI